MPHNDSRGAPRTPAFRDDDNDVQQRQRAATAAGRTGGVHFRHAGTC